MSNVALHNRWRKWTMVRLEGLCELSVLGRKSLVFPLWLLAKWRGESSIMTPTVVSLLSCGFSHLMGIQE